MNKIEKINFHCSKLKINKKILSLAVVAILFSGCVPLNNELDSEFEKGNWQKINNSTVVNKVLK